MTTQMKRFLLLIIGMTVVFLPLYSFLHGSRLDISIVSNIMAVVAGCWSYFNIRNSQYLKQGIGFTAKDIRLLITVLLLFAIGAVIVLLGYKQSLEQYLLVSSWPDGVTWVGFAVIICFYILVSIPLQEFIFRGYFLSLLSGFLKSGRSAAVISSLLFGIVHLQYGFNFIVITFIFGLMLSWLMLRTKKLTYPIIAHVIAGLGLFVVYFFVG